MRSAHSRKQLVIAAGYVAGAFALYRGLPEYGAASGGGTVSVNALMLAFLFPTAAAFTDALLRRLCISHPVDESGSAPVLATYDAIMLRFIIFIVSVHGVMLLAVAGLFTGRGSATQIVPVMLGFTMIGIGNLLPRTRPNLAIGIRTQRALTDRALWARIHRSAGYLLVASGIVIVLSSIVVPAPIGSTMVLVVGPALLAGTCLLVRFSRRGAHA
jgi:hypothetical protein